VSHIIGFLSPQNFDRVKWLGHLATDDATDGADGEKDNFIVGREDTDVEKSSVAVMVMNCESDDSISVEPMQCPQATNLISQLQRRRRRGGAKAYVRLYPEKLPLD
jgi:hypothetical protein